MIHSRDTLARVVVTTRARCIHEGRDIRAAFVLAFVHHGKPEAECHLIDSYAHLAAALRTTGSEEFTLLAGPNESKEEIVFLIRAQLSAARLH